MSKGACCRLQWFRYVKNLRNCHRSKSEDGRRRSRRVKLREVLPSCTHIRTKIRISPLVHSIKAIGKKKWISISQKVQFWYQLIPSIDLASNIVYKIKHYPRGKNREVKVARRSTNRLLLVEEDADVVSMTTAARAYRTTLPLIAGCPSVPTINEKYFWNSRVKINIEETQYMCTTLFKD